MKYKTIQSIVDDYLKFTFDQVELNCYFTGKPGANFLFSVKDKAIVNAVSQYLNHPDFSHLQVNNSSLEFGNMRLKLLGDIVYIFLKEKLEIKNYQDKKVYLPNENDLVLWMILNAKEDFNIEKIRKEIQIENASLKNLN